MQKCPLCGTEAEFTRSDFGKRKHFNCSSCSEFIITLSAENRLSTSIPEWRKQMAASAKSSSPDNILEIKTVAIPGKSSDLVAEYIPRSTLRP